MISKKQLILILYTSVFNTFFCAYAQTNNNTSIRKNYEQSYDLLDSCLKNNSSFKDAVFIAENCYKANRYSKQIFQGFITEYAVLCKLNIDNITDENNKVDSFNFIGNYAIFKLLCDTSIFINKSDSISTLHLPFKYDEDDPSAKHAWSNMFVFKLLLTHTGNCHSLVYLYKILADELHVKCWLSLAPNHIYIRNYSEKSGWYNTELTSGTFPTDAWIMTTTNTPSEAVRNGLYMDTLSNQQSIALCVLDLAKGYEFQTHNYTDGFILKCCDLVLKYHSINPMALLLKAESLKKLYLKQHKLQLQEAAITYSKMSNTYITLAKMGYREIF
ncbi:hypothetical protein [Chitinophaga sp. LS1]|uniref:hypothetical protein n=1 Tax=Chitinophaga sp. LS1 TaxID=3051176 RepID=UPI002AAC1572|nr:hypothetical protein [Chitinophaga sp. LS1]WPV63960.1 hypothetical protein QQL36_19355 [Chitinophaga sp. LS1]